MTDPLFRNQYPILVNKILSDGFIEYNARTGMKLKGMQGVVFTVYDCMAGLLPIDGFRKQYPKSSAAEVAWFITGSRSLREAKALGCNFWDKFAEDDGDTIKAAYGYRWRKHFGRDQLALAIEALKTDLSNRQVVVSAWDPALDGLGSSAKNVPCPAMFSLNRIGNRLHSTLFIRSSDVFVGLPYDVMGHAILMDLLANSLGPEVGVGTLTFSLAHAHIYQTHWDMAQQGLSRLEESHRCLASRGAMFLSERLDLSVQDTPEKLVQNYRLRSNWVFWPEFNPVPEVVP